MSPEEAALRVLVVGLAAWRVAHLLVVEDGPWGVLRRVRVWVGAEVDLASEAVERLPGGPQGFIAQLLACVWCLTVWTALGFWGLWELHWGIPGVVAAMAVAMLAQAVAERS